MDIDITVDIIIVWIVPRISKKGISEATMSFAQEVEDKEPSLVSDDGLVICDDNGEGCYFRRSKELPPHGEQRRILDNDYRQYALEIHVELSWP